MTTNDYIHELERDVHRQKILETMETDPAKKAAIKKRKASSMKLLKGVRSIFGRKFVTSEGDVMEYETAAFKGEK